MEEIDLKHIISNNDRYAPKVVVLSGIYAEEEEQSASNWEYFKFPSLDAFAKEAKEVIQNKDCHISPIRWISKDWKGERNYNVGYRCEANFQYANCIIGEIDDSMSLQNFIAIIEKHDLECFIHTSKSHQKPKGENNLVADRFHFILRLDAPVENVDIWRKLNKVLHLYFPVDKTYDGARKYRCADNCEIISITGSKKLSVKNMLLIADKYKITSGRNTYETVDVKHGGDIDNRLLNQINQYALKLDSGLHTYLKIWCILTYASSKCLNADIVAATAWENEIIKDYYQRKRKTSYFLKEVGKAFASARNYIIEKYELITPPTPQVFVSPSKLPCISTPELTKMNEWYSKNNVADNVQEKITETYAFLKYLIEDEPTNSILNAACGDGKSVSSSFYASINSGKYLFVKSTIEDCIKQKEYIESMDSKCGVIVSFNERYCKAGYTAKDHRSMINKKHPHA